MDREIPDRRRIAIVACAEFELAALTRQPNSFPFSDATLRFVTAPRPAEAGDIGGPLHEDFTSEFLFFLWLCASLFSNILWA